MTLIQRNNFQTKEILIHGISFLFNKIITFIQRIMYISNGRTIFIQQIIYTFNQLFIYSTVN